MSGLWRNESDTPEGKYPIVLRRDGTVVTTGYFVLLDRDPAFIDAMSAYADSHKRQGSDPKFVQDIYDWVNDVINDTNVGDITPGDPDAPRHRTDDPKVLAWARAVHSKSACILVAVMLLVLFVDRVNAQTFPRWPDNQTVKVFTLTGAFTSDEQGRIKTAVEAWRPLLPAGMTMMIAGEALRIEECQGCVTLDRKPTKKEDWGACRTVRDVATNRAMYTEISIDRRAGSNISFQIVVEHEIGHALTLEHRGKSVMDHHAATSWIHRHPSEKDAAILRMIYANQPSENTNKLLSRGRARNKPQIERVGLVGGNNSDGHTRSDNSSIDIPSMEMNQKLEAANTEALKSHSWKLTVSIQTLDEDGKVNGTYDRVSRVVLDDQGNRYEKVLSKHSHLKGMRITKADKFDFLGPQMGLIDFTNSRFTQGTNGAIHVEPVSSDKRGYSGDIWVSEKGIEKFIGTTLPEKSERFPIFTATRREVEGHLFPSEMSSEGVLQFKGGAVRYRWKVSVSDYRLFGSRVSVAEVSQ